MGVFLAADTLKEAVQRLGGSVAQGAVTDFAIFKRALVNARRSSPKAKDVETGLESPSFQEAIREFTACVPSEVPHAWNGPPYFSPFGSQRDKQRGFKSAKYPSNGPSDTVGGWQSRSSSPLRLVLDTRPKRYEFVPRSEDELRAFFIKQQAGPLPRLEDAARWWFRAKELSKIFGHEPTIREICDEFAKQIDLQALELAALFDTADPAETDPAGHFDAGVADPVMYLPAAIAAVPKEAKAAAKLSSSSTVAAIDEKVEQVVTFVAARGFVFEPWQVAAFVTAVRTKPFVILAGISGTGKTKLPRLVAEATGAEIDIIPVHPDWTDGSELIGYERIDGVFVPGRLLRLAKRAQETPEKQFFALLDEMNIARVEYYLADVLSHIEERARYDGQMRSKPLVPQTSDSSWNSVCLPSNLCIVGSVNMDETTHGFSRKVLDRSFVIEFSDVDLTRVGTFEVSAAAPSVWSAEEWRQNHLTLAEHSERGGVVVDDVVGVLETINDALSPAQLQVGYRVRDEVALFRLNARDCEQSFRAFDAGSIDPLDLAITMKILPRIQGGGAAIQQVLDSLRAWSNPDSSPEGVAPVARRAFPLCQARIELMHSRLRSGFTSYWL